MNTSGRKTNGGRRRREALTILVSGIGLGIMAGFFLGYYLGRRNERNFNRNMKKWERTREKGQGHFILTKGILLWGGLTGMTSFILVELLEPSPLWMLHLFMNMTLFPLGGILWGRLVWRSAEKKYYEWLMERSLSRNPLVL
ncbi:MAG: hypothetical protein JW939_09170 [Candidatus Thermoplasmatota archaeon]|nr:hypothetical protein [Candidatus Thermoplasmatota archaeon]